MGCGDFQPHACLGCGFETLERDFEKSRFKNHGMRESNINLSLKPVAKITQSD